MSTAEYDSYDDDIFFGDGQVETEDVTIVGYSAGLAILLFAVGQLLGMVTLSSIAVVGAIVLGFTAYLMHENDRPLTRNVALVGTLPLWLMILQALIF